MPEEPQMQKESNCAQKGSKSGLDLEVLRRAIGEQPLFEDKSWRLSPFAFPLSRRQLDQLQQIGEGCLHFFRALERLYSRSRQGKNLLRNRKFEAPWVAEYLDRGKPEHLRSHSLHEAVGDQLPFVIRPDLLVTEEGFALTEMDAVPGGVGLTAFLNRLYEPASAEVIGADDAMVETFYRNLARLAPDYHTPFIAILMTDEAATYRPEMEWIAGELQKRGKRVFVFDPEEVMPLGNTLCVDIDGSPQRIDIIYRFFELFDLPNISTARHLLKAVEKQEVALTPPIRHFQEEKLNLALFHHHALEDYWKESMPKAAHKALQKTVPRSWVMDPVELPPNAVLDAPNVGGKPISRWEQLAAASQKERNLIIKISGYHETAWGARSVTLGSDSSRGDWAQAIEQAVEMAGDHLHVLQEYRKPARLRHRVYKPDGSVYSMEGRMRLCPYFFVDGFAERVEMQGILATFCPADKKIIHGMKDAALIPCVVGGDAVQPAAKS